MKMRIMCDGEEIATVGGYLAIAMCNINRPFDQTLDVDGIKYDFIEIDFYTDGNSNGVECDAILTVEKRSC